MYISLDKKNKKREKILERPESRSIQLTEERNLSISQADSTFETGCGVVVTPSIRFARFGGGGVFCNDCSDDTKVALAIYTPSCLLSLDETRPFWVRKNESVEKDEVFFLYFVTTEFSELMAVNGKYGNKCIFRMYPSEQAELSLQVAQMLLASYEGNGIPELIDWITKNIQLQRQCQENG